MANREIYQKARIIQDNKNRRWDLIISGEDKIRFDANEVYRFLGPKYDTDWYDDLYSDFIYFENIEPAELGDNVYYIPSAPYNALTDIFNEFNIPIDENKVLIHYYLSMFLAGNQCKEVDLFNSNQKKELAKFRDFYDLLQSVSGGDSEITGGNIFFKSKDSEGRVLELSKKAIDPNSIELIESFIKHGLSDLKLRAKYDKLYALRIKNLREGYKNSVSAKIDQYSLSMFRYLKSVSMDKPLSDRKMYLLIGKVVVESELLDRAKGEDDDSLIDLIKKRIQKKLKSKK